MKFAMQMFMLSQTRLTINMAENTDIETFFYNLKLLLF